MVSADRKDNQTGWKVFTKFHYSVDIFSDEIPVLGLHFLGDETE